MFRTYEPARDRLVAVKVFRLDITPEQAQSLADALAVAADAGLFHPSIVEPIASGVEGTVAYRAEEYVAAESLDVAFRQYSPAPLSRLLPFVTQLAGAVDFARASGVGHGALHPRDIFVTPEEARVTGFGVVEALESVGLRAPVRRPYSAPERVAGGSWSTPADVFSLAAIAYELLTGKRPSGTGSQIGSLDGTGVGRDSVAAVHAVFARAMDEDPQARYSTALEFASALEGAAQARGGAEAAAVPIAAAAPVTAALNDPEIDADEGVPIPGVDEQVDDIAAESEADEAHTALVAEHAAADESLEPALFHDEHDEAVEDLALDRHEVISTERFADEFSIAADETSEDQPSSDSDRSERAEIFAGAAAVGSGLGLEDRSTHEARTRYAPSVDSGYGEGALRDDTARRTGPSWMAAAALIVLALLVGFLAGQMMNPTAGPQEASSASNQPTTAASSDPEDTAPASPTTAGAATAGEAPSAGSAEASAPAPAPPPAPVSRAAEPPAAAPPKTGTITIRSSPSGASVTIDGKWRGRTPATIEDVAFGSREVRVVQPGYAVVSEEVTLSPKAPTRTLSYRLQRTPAPQAAASTTAKPSAPAKPSAAQKPGGYTGSIYVDSLPRGAQVFLNGRAVGNTPVLVPDVPVGSQIVRLQLEDHRTWVATARVVAGQQVKVSGSLERIR